LHVFWGEVDAGKLLRDVVAMVVSSVHMAGI